MIPRPGCCGSSDSSRPRAIAAYSKISGLGCADAAWTLEIDLDARFASSGAGTDGARPSDPLEGTMSTTADHRTAGCCDAAHDELQVPFWIPMACFGLGAVWALAGVAVGWAVTRGR